MEQLPWEKWKKRAEAAYVKGEYGVAQMVADWGYPEGMSAETYKIEFDKGSVKRKDRVGRREQRAKAEAKRGGSTAVQTVGTDVYGKGIVNVGKDPAFQEHHKRIVKVYEPFFEGLDTKEAKDLAEWFATRNQGLGNTLENLVKLPIPVHESIHQWAQDNFIQPKNGKPLLNFKDVPLDKRKAAAEVFLEYVQPALDEKLDELVLDFSKGSAQLNKNALAMKRAKTAALAGAGVAALGPLGSAASAAETAERTSIAQQTKNPLDYLQAGISGISTAADVASYAPPAAPIGEAISTTADIANLGIDAVRSIDWGNELQYVGSQLKKGKLPYGLEGVMSHLQIPMGF